MSNSMLPILASPTAAAVGREQAVADGDPTERAGQFAAVSGPDVEQVSASGMVIWAYGLFWVIVLVLVAQTYRGQTKLLARIAELEKKLPKDDLVS